VRIASVDSTPLAIPLVRPFHWSSGAQVSANLVRWTVETRARERYRSHGPYRSVEPAHAGALTRRRP
jgi:hypothetical protein